MMVHLQGDTVSHCHTAMKRGTHIRNTSEIGPVAVTKIENKGKQNRRVIVALAE
jgi:Ser-tRNA(Ala) deacylase AlaX